MTLRRLDGRRAYQRDGVGQGAAQDVADLTELHARHVRVQDLHLHRLVFPAPLLVGDARCGGETERERRRGGERRGKVEGQEERKRWWRERRRGGEMERRRRIG